MGVPTKNWAGNQRCVPVGVHLPTSTTAVAAIVRTAAEAGERVKVIGGAHSFTDIADAVDLIDLSDIDRLPEFDADARSITVSGTASYADVARSLRPHGAALRNLASLPHISVAGAISTGTHGSGAAHGNLATSVAGLEFIASSGEIVGVDRKTPDFEGMVVSLGAFGMITTVTLDVDFDYEIAQHVYDDLPLDLAVDQLGFVQVGETLASVSHPNVFAVGDIAAYTPRPLPKAGVYAVRQGPVLAENLRQFAKRGPLKPYRPQRRFLSLLSGGGRFAVASYGGFAASGGWVWRWKDRIGTCYIPFS